MSTCLICNSEHNNPKFCSRSCAAIFNNKKHPKRKAERIPCKRKECVNLILKSTKNKYCNKECKPIVINGNKTMKEMLDTSNCHRATIHSKIRESARRVAKKLGLKQCHICSYNLHVEICHLKSISSFSLEVPISIINHPNNLVALYRNHHWEQENGYLTIIK